MHASTRAAKKQALRDRGLLDLEDLLVVARAATGKNYHIDTARLWIDHGRYGIKLHADKAGGKVLVRIQDALEFFARTGMSGDEYEMALNENAFGLPLPPCCESPEHTRQFDRLAILKSRMERIKAFENSQKAEQSSM